MNKSIPTVERYLRACQRAGIDPMKLRQGVILPKLSQAECEQVAALTQRPLTEIQRLCGGEPFVDIGC